MDEGGSRSRQDGTLTYGTRRCSAVYRVEDDILIKW